MVDPVAQFAARHAPGAKVLRFPSRDGALIALFMSLHDELPPGDAVVVADLVWQTAPTPELIQAFAPPPGREKVRPIEGYEMQAEHAGFAIAARETLPRELAARTPEQEAALRSDDRGAARVVGWVFRRAE